MCGKEAFTLPILSTFIDCKYVLLIFACFPRVDHLHCSRQDKLCQREQWYSIGRYCVTAKIFAKLGIRKYFLTAEIFCLVGHWKIFYCSTRPIQNKFWFGLVWFGLVWFGLVWFGLVWFGLVWQVLSKRIDLQQWFELWFYSICIAYTLLDREPVSLRCKSQIYYILKKDIGLCSN